jgi:hypothetical protein
VFSSYGWSVVAARPSRSRSRAGHAARGEPAEEVACGSANLPRMLPNNELDAFLLTVTDAIDLAREGDAAEGYTVLLVGLHRAEQARDDGEP